MSYNNTRRDAPSPLKNENCRWGQITLKCPWCGTERKIRVGIRDITERSAD